LGQSIDDRGLLTYYYKKDPKWEGGMIRYTGINHLAMATGDMDRTIRFWRDLLGMRLVAGLGKPGYRHYFFEISPQDLIAFFEWSGVEPLPEKEHGYPVKGPFIFDHIALGVENEEELWKVKDRLEAAGCEPSPVINHGFIHSIYAFDPNGIPIEFRCPVPEVDIRAHPTLIDSAPSETARVGPEPRPEAWPPVQIPTPPDQRKVYPGVGSELFHGFEKE
jgi:catechol 2,3-dioxygenase-like lactoylglutathione lyase family enzyme